MSKNNANNLLDKLGASLDQKKATPAKAPEKAPTQSTGAGKSDIKPMKKADRLAKNRNLSLYPEDFKAMKDIQDIIYDSTGIHPSASLAVRIALRSCTRSQPELLKIFEQIRNEDGRIKA